MMDSAQQKEPPARVVVVDDEPLILEAWQESFAGHTRVYEVVSYADPLQAAAYFEGHAADVVLLDLRMPRMNGMELLKLIRRDHPATQVIVITGHGTIQLAVEAMQNGAYNFLCKPIEDLDAALRMVDTATDHKRLHDVNTGLNKRLAAHAPQIDLIGDDEAIVGIRSLIDRIADSMAPVLIYGESGTGKELVARALHAQSKRRQKPFVAVNCAAISENLIDSELFGHEKGSFTGAVAAHRGLFEAADGGDLFLDELGDMPQQTQVRLLRALQEGEIKPVGSVKSRKVNVRVIAATNVDLKQAIEDGRFREDLYYRISTFRVDLPPLRERRSDIAKLAHYLLAKMLLRGDRETVELASETIEKLESYGWPGNVRELYNVVEHGLTLCNGALLTPAHLPAFVGAADESAAAASSVGAEDGGLQQYSDARKQLLEDFETNYLSDLLDGCEGNLSEASRRSGIDRTNLRRMIQRRGLDIAAFRR